MTSRSFNISRRNFLKTYCLSAAGAGLPAWFIERELLAAPADAKLPSPNDLPGIALVGCGGMGRVDAGLASRFGEIVAVCDVDDKHASEAVKQFTKDGKAPAKLNDFRQVMGRSDVQVVITGTPDHWHTLVNLAATKAGKDVYGEKPLTLTIDEGRRLVEAVRKHKTMFQVGSQQRSDRNFRLACELVRNGRIGKLQHIIVGLPTGPREGPFSSVAIPDGMNWDFYLGQAPKMDYV